MGGFRQVEFIGIACLAVIKAVKVVYLPCLCNNGAGSQIGNIAVYVEYKRHIRVFRQIFLGG